MTTAEKRARQAAYDKGWRERNPERVRQLKRDLYARHPGRAKYATRSRRQAHKVAAMSAYGGKCVACGERDIDMLCIDHIHGGRGAHIRKLRGHELTRWLKKHNYPAGFQVLCANHNLKKMIQNKEF